MKHTLVAVIGDAILDHLRLGRVARQSPEDPSCPVIHLEREDLSLGGAANVAQWLAAVDGILVDFYCGQANRKLRALCQERRVSLNGVNDGLDLPITTKERLVVLQEPGSNRCLARVDRDVREELSVSQRNAITQSIDLRRPSVIVVADYDKGFFSGHNGYQLIQWLARYCEQAGALLIVNSKVILRWRSVPVTCLICNAIEFAEANVTEDTPITTTVAAELLVVTQGASGVRAVIRRDGAKVESPAPSASVTDVTGAGDAFLAGLTSELIRLRLEAKLAPPLKLDDSAVNRLIYAGQRSAAHCCSQLGCGEPLTDLLEA